MICNPPNPNTVTIGSATTVDLAPALNSSSGTYIFYNVNLSVQSNATLECTTCSPGPGGNGVTIIFTGPAGQIGTLTIGGSSTTILNAPYTNKYNAAFDGVLFYVDNRQKVQDKVSIGGGANVKLTGGMFFPSTEIDYAGQAVASSACNEIVGKLVVISAGSTFSVSDCATVNTPTSPTTAGSGSGQKVTLVE